MKNNRMKSPKTAYWLICKIFGKEDHPTLIGDFEEIFTEIAKEKGLFAASLWYWSQIVKALPAFIINQVYWRMTMVKNYFKIALRNMIRYKGFSFINITGLSVGIACCLLIFLWVWDESSYDNYHKDADRIYRVALEIKTSTHTRFFALTCLPLGPALKDNFPQVEKFVRFMRWRELLVKYGEDKKFYEKGYYFADPEVFEMFRIPFVKGNPKTALNRPSTVVISENIARKYFGNQDPMGKMLDISGPFLSGNFEITGVIRNIPHNTHLTFDFLTPIDVVKDYRGVNTWTTTMYYTYIKTAKNADSKQLGNQIKSIANQYIGKDLKEAGMVLNFFLQPLKDIHLYSHLSYEAEEPGNPLYIYIFTAVAVFILLIACINFMNLTTAHSFSRTLEVGMRKVAGAHRSQLVKQFLAESLFLCAIAFFIAIILVRSVLPFFNVISGKPLGFDFFTNIYLFIGIIGVFLFVGIFSGSYPAFFLSSLRPVLLTKNMLSKVTKTSALRKTLVVFQFTVSIILIVGSLIVHRQLNFMKNHALGFNKEQVVVLPVREIRGFSQSYVSIKNEFLQLQSANAVTASDSIPGRQLANFTIKRLDEEKDKLQNMYHLFVDHDFIDVFNINLAAGRSFLPNSTADVESAFMINEAAAKSFGWNSGDEAVGKRIESSYANRKGGIIGVFKDFNYQSLHAEVKPLVLTIRPERFIYLSMKVKGDNEAEILASLRSKWEKLFPDKPFEYFFLDKDFERQYQSSDKIGKIFGIFTILAIIIAGLGLLGLVSFMTRQRSKEVAIRKVVGASAASIVLLISKEFTKLVGIAYILALPTSYFIMVKWLNNFAYRINPGFWTFIGAGILSFAIALLTMSYQAIKAARLNPVDILKCE